MMHTDKNSSAGIRALKLAALATVATGALAAPGFESTAQAQALQPAVDVCSGITLPRSAVTEIIGAVNQPIVDQIETTVNGLTTVTLILAPLATITDLDIDVSSILADAEAGDPISLQILDTAGNVITASDDCNVTADSFTLNEEAGIAIGGNQITGLGANGQTASAGELDAIAFGNNASTSPGATGAVAIGTDASVTAPNSVALGAGSLADRADTVSVGAPGATRQIVNVADGTEATDAATVGQVDAAIQAAVGNPVQYDDATQAQVTLEGADGTTVTNLADGAVSVDSTDAVNGSQLFATNQDVAGNTADIAALDSRVTVNEADIAALEDTAVRYDDPTQTSITLGGAEGTTISNLADGELSATSTEAVNGSQLFATNQAVDALDTRVTQNESDIATNAAAIAGLEVTTGEFGDRITQNETDIANLDGRVTVNEGDIASLDGRVTVNEGDIDSLDGRVTVNEGDIASLDGRVTVNEGDISTLQTQMTNTQNTMTNMDNRITTVSNNVTTLAVRLDNVPVTYVSDADGTTPSTVPTDTAAFVGASGGAVRVTNVDAGDLSATSTDAVNGSQLFATNQQVAQNTADITTINNNLAGSTVVAVQYSDPDNPTVSNGGTITNNTTLVGANAAAPVVLSNVANGLRANDAANFGQLQAGLANVMSSSMAYTDQRAMEAMAYTDRRFEDLSFDLAEMRDEAFAGTAAAMAMASIPQAIDPSKSMVAGSVGHYRGETAFGFGYSGISGSGKMVFKVQGTLDTNGKGGAAVGAGFSF